MIAVYSWQNCITNGNAVGLGCATGDECAGGDEVSDDVENRGPSCG